MESNYITLILLPLALGIIMLGLGISLSIADFKRVILYPKATIIGLACQMLVLPVLCFLIAKTFGLSPELSVGLMLLSASPGGPTANLFSHLAKGDVALNISLTAINSLLTLITLPLIVNFSFVYFMGADYSMPMQFKKVIEVVFIVLIPVILGMFIKSKKPSLSSSLEKPIKIVSALFLASIIVLAIIKERENFVSFFQQVGIATLVFNVLSMAIGFYMPKLFKIEKKQSISIGMEVGIHNGTLAIYIALSTIGNSAMSIPPAIYSLIMFFTAAIFGYLVNLDNKDKSKA